MAATLIVEIYECHGTTSPLAALEIASGRVIGQLTHPSRDRVSSDTSFSAMRRHELFRTSRVNLVSDPFFPSIACGGSVRRWIHIYVLDPGLGRDRGSSSWSAGFMHCAPWPRL